MELTPATRPNRTPDEYLELILSWQLRADAFSDVLWNQIGQASGSKEKLKSLLAGLSRDVLITFHKEFRRALYNLWRESDAGDWMARSQDEYLSEDTQEDIFAYVVSQGKNYDDEILAHPERLRQDIRPQDVPFLGAAREVFLERFKEEIDLQE